MLQETWFNWEVQRKKDQREWIGTEDHVWASCKHNYSLFAKRWLQKVRYSIVDGEKKRFDGIWTFGFDLIDKNVRYLISNVIVPKGRTTWISITIYVHSYHVNLTYIRSTARITNIFGWQMWDNKSPWELIFTSRTAVKNQERRSSFARSLFHHFHINIRICLELGPKQVFSSVILFAYIKRNAKSVVCGSKIISE